MTLNEEYNQIISDNLKDIPNKKSNKKYSLPERYYGSITLHSDDLVIWERLYSILPSTKDGVEQNRGVGNGEIATYWLLKRMYDVNSGGEGEQPDLLINNIGLEVKAYNKKQIEIGRFTSQRYDNIRRKLMVLLGIRALFSSVKDIAPDKPDIRTVAIDSLNDTKLLECIEIALSVYQSIKDPLFQKLDMMKALKRHIEDVLGLVKVKDVCVQSVAANLLRELLYTKLEIKPGREGYFVDTQLETPQLTFYKINPDTLHLIDNETILKSVSTHGGAIKLNFNNLAEVFKVLESNYKKI